MLNIGAVSASSSGQKNRKGCESLNRIDYNGVSYTDDKIVSAELFSEISPVAESLGYGTLNAVVKSIDTNILIYTKNSPLQYYKDNELYFTFFVKNIKRSGAMRYNIEAFDSIGLLANRQHMGGIYTGQTVGEIISDICGDVPFAVSEQLTDTRLYGWLPIASRRDNLKQVLFALGGAAKVSADGTVNISALQRDTVASISKVGKDADVDYPAPVSAVKLTEHQFIKSSTTETETLYEGMADEKNPITFDEPVYDLAATGFEIIEQGANYVYVTSGSGTITGKKYVHTKRVMSEQITADADENEAIYEDATLISVVNSASTLSRLVNYHKQGDVITANTRLMGQHIGDIVNLLHPHERKMVSAFLLDAQLTVSKNISAAQRFLIGFRPPDPNAGYYNTVELLTGSGTWTPPESVKSVRVVLIGGGNGGWSGLPGEAAGAASMPTQTNGNTQIYRIWPGRGGKGGKSGSPGDGGKIYQEIIEVTSGESISYYCGEAGKGAVYSSEASTPGSEGKATTFGALSSSSGINSPIGFLEEVSGEIYGATGEDGTAGGNGIGINDDNTDVDEGSTVEYEGITYVPGANSESISRDNYPKPSGTSVQSAAGGGYGGGPAAGANGQPGEDNRGAAINSRYAAIVTGHGGKGADAILPSAETQYGKGGKGGNGGGGGGGNGAGYIFKESNVSSVTGIEIRRYPGTPGAGGAGSNGGDGAPGCIILYYYLPGTSE